MKAQIYVGGKLVWIKRVYKDNCNNWQYGDWLIDPEIITKITTENIKCYYEIIDVKTREAQYIEKYIIQAAFPYIDYIINNWENNNCNKINDEKTDSDIGILDEFFKNPKRNIKINDITVNYCIAAKAISEGYSVGNYKENSPGISITSLKNYSFWIPADDLEIIKDCLNNIKIPIER